MTSSRFRLIARAWSLVGLLLVLNGCASRRLPVSGYLGLQEEFTNLDLSPLKDRRILLDPGHGGFFKGALGPRGLTEAEVNLGVAQYLRGLLEWAGAQVAMTRTADYDFLSPADSTLTRDLTFRTSLMDSLQPDVFISIHHNSTANRDPQANETQTYYPLGDEGASLDLAKAIHRHLVLNLQISPAKILPGNFFVLRRASVPAVLGEPAMISNPVMEGRLSLAASQELEAKAYFLGLLDYFGGGQPHWSGAACDTLEFRPGVKRQPLSWTFLAADSPELTAPGPDPASYELTLDGRPQGFDLSPDGRNLSWLPPGNLSVGQHRLLLKGRNLKGRATPHRCTILDVRPPWPLRVQICSETAANQARVMVHWETLDGQPAPAGYLIWGPDRKLPLASRHEGWFLLPRPRVLPPSLTFVPRTGQERFEIAVQRAPDLDPGNRWRLIDLEPTPPLGWRRRRTACATEQPFGPGTPAVVLQPDAELWIEAEGVRPLVRTSQPDLASTTSVASPIWRPQVLFPQIQGRTIVLDPAGGGTENDGLYPLGTRGADLNLETARQTKALLEGAGARVFLTREAEVAPSDQSKVLLANDRHADLFLTIGRAPGAGLPSAEHHPGSRLGIKGAQALAHLLPGLKVQESYAYLLRHTACPALEVRFQAPQDADQEMFLASPAWSQTEGRALLLACLEIFSGEDQAAIPTVDPGKLVAMIPGGFPGGKAQWARWDGNFEWLPVPSPHKKNPLALFSEPGWPAQPGPHTLEVHAQGSWQLWRVDTSAGETEFHLLLENR